MAELMVKAHNFTNSYAKCLLAATPEDQLVEPQKPKAPRGLAPNEVADMEKEMQSLEQNFLALEETHGQTMLHLVMVSGFLRKMLENSAVAKYLSSKHSEICAEFKKLIEAMSLERM